MNYRFALIILASALLFLTACEKEEIETPATEKDWLEILEESGSYHLFAEAARKLGLHKEHSGSHYTLLVPSDSVFQDYLTATGAGDIENWIQIYGENVVKLVLHYHMIDGTGIRADQFTSSFIASMAVNNYGNQISLQVNADGPAVKINGTACLTGSPYQKGQLAIHEIDRVLYLPTVMDLVAHDSGFSLLRASLKAAGTGLEALLRQDNESFCFFAPTNRGFQNFLANNSAFSDFESFKAQYSSQQMSDLLFYHMLPQVVRSDSFTDGSYATRLKGQSITVYKDIHGSISLMDARGNSAKLMLTDIHALNGVVHSIDNVLQPL